MIDDVKPFDLFARLPYELQMMVWEELLKLEGLHPHHPRAHFLASLPRKIAEIFFPTGAAVFPEIIDSTPYYRFALLSYEQIKQLEWLSAPDPAAGRSLLRTDSPSFRLRELRAVHDAARRAIDALRPSFDNTITLHGGQRINIKGDADLVYLDALNLVPFTNSPTTVSLAPSMIYGA